MKPIVRIALAVVLTGVVAGCARSGPPAPIVDRTLTYDDLLAAAGRAANEVGERIADGVARVVAEVAPEPAPSRPADPPVQIASTAPQAGVARKTGITNVSVAALPELTAAPGAAAFASAPPNAATEHRVAKGDTVYALARRYGVEPKTLMAANDLRAPYTLRVGDTLRVPSAASAAPADAAPIQVAAAPVSQPLSLRPPHPKARPLPQPRSTGVVLASAGPAPKLRPAPPPRARVAYTGPVGAPPPRAGGAFAWPVDGHVLASYGALDGGRHNDGLNIAAPRGTPVRAAENGVVVYAGNEIRGFGNLVLLKHAGGIITAYAHNDALLVGRGDVVDKGAAIARVGRSGGVTEPQLHFEIRRGTEAVDPRPLLSRQELAAR